VQAIRDDANEAVREAAQALALEPVDAGYPTIERRRQEGDPAGLDALETIIQREADSKRRQSASPLAKAMCDSSRPEAPDVAGLAVTYRKPRKCRAIRADPLR
jgi:hypothetical protein